MKDCELKVIKGKDPPEHLLYRKYLSEYEEEWLKKRVRDNLGVTKEIEEVNDKIDSIQENITLEINLNIENVTINIESNVNNKIEDLNTIIGDIKDKIKDLPETVNSGYFKDIKVSNDINNSLYDVLGIEESISLVSQQKSPTISLTPTSSSNYYGNVILDPNTDIVCQFDEGTTGGIDKETGVTFTITQNGNNEVIKKTGSAITSNSVTVHSENTYKYLINKPLNIKVELKTLPGVYSIDRTANVIVKRLNNYKITSTPLESISSTHDAQNMYKNCTFTAILKIYITTSLTTDAPIYLDDYTTNTWTINNPTGDRGTYYFWIPTSKNTITVRTQTASSWSPFFVNYCAEKEVINNGISESYKVFKSDLAPLNADKIEITIT